MTGSAHFRQVDPSLAPNLARFYEALSEPSKRTFHPLGEHTTPEACEAIARDNADGVKYDVVALKDEIILGWGFLWSTDTDAPVFGLAVADHFQGQGIGAALMDRMVTFAQEREFPQVVLTVVRDNVKAKALYESRGFRIYEEFVGEDALPYYRMRLTLREP